MVSQLESQLRAKIAAGFKGKLLTGTLTRLTATSVDDYGDPVAGKPETFSVEGFVDNYDAKYRAQAGIPETDSQITLILGNSETEPLKDDKVSFSNWPEFQIRNVEIDPARASAICQAFNP